MACPCSPPSLHIPFTHIFSLKSTTATFIPLSGPLDATTIDALRARMDIAALSSNLSLQLAYQTSDDLLSWTDVAVGTARTANGTTYEAASNLNEALFYRVGILVKNVSSSEDCHSALVQLFLDFSLT